MSPEAAAVAIQMEVEEQVRQIRAQADARLPRAANQLMNARLDVLSGPSPSSPGNPPGVRSGDLRRNWTPYFSAGGGEAVFGIESGMNYAGYLENGTKNKDGSLRMAARPFVDKIQEQALPGIIPIFREIGG